MLSELGSEYQDDSNSVKDDDITLVLPYSILEENTD